MAGFKKMVEFLLVLVCLAAVPLVNGSCSSRSQCYPGGECLEGRCVCLPGYKSTGSSCSLECNPACQNGGSCQGSLFSSYCTCPSGYSGSYCQTTACSPACQNGGTCHGSSYSAYCTCASGYSGSHCQNRECSPACQNGGSCQGSLFSSYCTCPSGYSGSYCQTTACSPACQNGGTCHGSSYSAYCTCASGYSGSHCQTRECYPSCYNGGTCSSSGVCRCAPGYTGSYCQHSSSGGSVGYVFGGVIGGIVFISCIVGITVLRICLRVASIRRRSENVEAARANPTSAGIGRRVLIIQRVRRVPPTNPDAPPPYVPSADVQSSDPPPYTTDPNNCPQPTSAEDTPTPQPLPPESAPPIPTDEDPPEYLPPPGSNLERQPLLVEEQ